MRRLLLALVVVGAGLATLSAPTASARDRDCSDFANQKQAQFFFLKHGGPRRDRHRLDGDHDGIACESLPCPCYRKRHLPRHRRDRDCSDFRNQRQAQFFFLRHGGPRRDRHRLDGDHDGIACESLPCPCYEEPPPPPNPDPTPPPEADRDCSDFANQAEAQSFFLEKGGPSSDPHGLDGDGDGIACESLPCPCSEMRRLVGSPRTPQLFAISAVTRGRS